MCYTQRCQVQLLVRDTSIFCLFAAGNGFFLHPSAVTALTSVVLTNTRYTSPWQHPFGRGKRSVFICGTAVVEACFCGPLSERREGLKPGDQTLMKESSCVKNTQTLLKGRQQLVLKVKGQDPYEGWVTVCVTLKTLQTQFPFKSSIPVKHHAGCLLQCNLRPLYTSHHVKYTTTLNLISLYYVNCYTHWNLFTKQTDC